MELDLVKLSNENRFEYDQDFSINLNIYKNKEIHDLKDLYLKGEIYLNSVSMLEVHLEITGVMIITDSVTNDFVDYPFVSKIDEEYDLNDENFLETYQKSQNILDIMKILWENIVLEVPMRFTLTEDAHLSGEGWSLGKNKNEDNNIDPRFAKLSELLDKGKE